MEQQKLEAAAEDKASVTGVSVLSSQKYDFLPEYPEINLGLSGKRPCSNPSSRFSKRRADLEEEILEDEARAKTERKQHELEPQQKQREMEVHQLQLQNKIEIDFQKEVLELVKFKRQKDLSVEMNKHEMNGQDSSRDSGCSASGSFRMQNVKITLWVNAPKNSLGCQSKTMVKKESQAVSSSGKQC